MLAAGYRPVEDYPGYVSDLWACVHIPCGSEIKARLQKIRAGEGCCGPCGMKASAAKRSVDSEKAQEVMLKALLEPLVPYPSNLKPWKCRCMTCGVIVYPTRANIWRGQGGCVPCGRRKNALARLGDAGKAEADMLAALLKPLEDYPGSNNPWRCECLRCCDEVRPRLGHIRQGRGGCWRCGLASSASNQLGDPVKAVADMKAAGYEPLEEYPGAGRPWQCVHEPCGNEVRARLQKIRSDEGCCAHCATYGFNLTAPAVVYVLHHPKHAVVKVGITAATSDRVARFEKKGFTVVGVVNFATGQQARDVEQAVLRHLRTELGLRHALTAEETKGVGGWTETFSADEVSPQELWVLVRKTAKEKPSESKLINI
jgi:hypothetical protein